jgi:hypothetical protein
MKKQVSKITFALACLSALAGHSQNTAYPCGTYEAMQAQFKADPSARARFEASQAYLRQLSESNASSQAKPQPTIVYTVPVVFHVLHQGGPENVPDATIISALQQINNDYARNSPDTNQIFKPFKNLYIDSEIRFMLAKKDPQGNCINGIVRHVDPKTNWDQTAAQQSFYWTHTWDPTKYLNIYLVANIAPQGTVTGGGIIIGYTHIPGQWPTGNPHDAIVYRYSALGSSFPNPACRDLAHEMGHWFSLPHTFGNTNNPGVVCGDDGITDTPPTKGNFSNCPASTTNTAFTCTSPNPTNSANYYQNVENIMDYSSCPKNFTAGQTNNMRTLLASNIAGRQNLWSSQNLAFTDVNGVIPCAPAADFLSNNLSYTVCAGGSLSFKDASSNGPFTSYQWSGDLSAVVAAPASSQTSIMFPNIGVCNVSLTVSNAQGSGTQVRQVYVLDGTPGITGPHFESFESPGLPPNWSIVDVDNDNLTWVQTGAAAYDGSYSYYIEGSTQPPNTSDYLVMPIMDVKNNPGNNFEFAYAYRQQASGHNDFLKIQGSRDCGGTWQDIVSLSAAVMQASSGGVDTTPFIPAKNEWKIYPISSHPNWINYLNSSSVMVRFNFQEGTNGYGNNIYVDAAAFFSPNGINELTRSMAFSLYPNPANEATNIHFNLSDGAKVKISVMDILGREVMKVADRDFAAGEQNIQINVNNTLPDGAYFVNMSVNGATMSTKLIVN